MKVKNKIIILVLTMVLLIICLTGLVYAASEKLFKEPVKNGTFVYILNNNEEGSIYGYIY